MNIFQIIYIKINNSKKYILKLPSEINKKNKKTLLNDLNGK